MSETIEFEGSGRDVLELMKKALCEFENVYLINAFLHPHHGFADEGRAVLDILINIPEEKKWISIHYSHHEIPIEIGGSGMISYVEHYYHREPFPQDMANESMNRKFVWKYWQYSGRYILDEFLERKKCKIRI